MTDTSTGDIGCDRAAFDTLSALISRNPDMTGNPAEYNCFTRVCESAVCLQLFINPDQHDFLPAQSDLNMSLTARVFFFKSSDNIQDKQDSVKFRIEDACCTRQPNS